MIEEVGKRINEERDRLELSEDGFAGIAECSIGTLREWENGVTLPSIAVLGKWARIGIDVLYIVTGQRLNEATPVLSLDKKLLLQKYDLASVDLRNQALAVLIMGDNLAKVGSQKMVIKQTTHGEGGLNIAGDVVMPKNIKQFVANNFGGKIFGDVDMVNVEIKSNNKKD